MVIEELIGFDTANFAKLKGFPQNIAYNYYLPDGKTMTDDFYKESLRESLQKKIINAPSQSLLQKWLREVHNLFIDIGTSFNGYSIEIMDKDMGNKWMNMRYSSDNEAYLTYEYALEHALQEALKLITNSK